MVLVTKTPKLPRSQAPAHPSAPCALATPARPLPNELTLTRITCACGDSYSLPDGQSCICSCGRDVVAPSGDRGESPLAREASDGASGGVGYRSGDSRQNKPLCYSSAAAESARPIAARIAARSELASLSLRARTSPCPQCHGLASKRDCCAQCAGSGLYTCQACGQSVSGSWCNCADISDFIET